MPVTAPLEFWFEFGSTYSYPAAMRIERLAREQQVPLVWRAFLLGPIFKDQGWNDSPFNLYPAKGRYMWRDLARICEAEGLPLRQPSRFPRNGLSRAHGLGGTRLAGEGRPGQGDALCPGCDGLTRPNYRRAFPSIQSAATSALASASAALATMIHL